MDFNDQNKVLNYAEINYCLSFDNLYFPLEDMNIEIWVLNATVWKFLLSSKVGSHSLYVDMVLLCTRQEKKSSSSNGVVILHICYIIITLHSWGNRMRCRAVLTLALQGKGGVGIATPIEIFPCRPIIKKKWP